MHGSKADGRSQNVIKQTAPAQVSVCTVGADSALMAVVAQIW